MLVLLLVCNFAQKNSLCFHSWYFRTCHVLPLIWLHHFHRCSNEGVKEQVRKVMHETQKHQIQMPLNRIPKSFLLEWFH